MGIAMNAKTLVLVYNTIGMIPFVLMPNQALKDSWKGIQEFDCSGGGIMGGKRKCVQTLEFGVGLIYFQVIVAMALQYACLVQFPNKKGRVGAVLILMAIMAKHIIVDGLIPPPPVMAMSVLVLLTNVAGPEVWGKRALVGFLALNAVTFAGNPLLVLQGTFPQITEGSEAHKIGKLMLEVVALYQASSFFAALLPGSALGLAFATQAGLPVLGKHVLIDKSGPPPFMIVLYLLMTVAAWYEVGWADLSKKTEEAIKVPMKLHATILITGFIPYFILESIGLSVPFVGMSQIDTSYSYNGSSAVMHGFCALFLSMIAYEEYTGRMEGKMFCMYHYVLSAVVFLWQCQPSTTMLGALFFLPPHVFTAWCAYIIIDNGEADKKKK